MFRRRYREQIPELNTTSTADISFMLLSFFLVTSSMDTEKGLMRQLPPPPQEQVAPSDINREHVLSVRLDASDRLTCDGEPLTTRQLTERVTAFAAADPEAHVISIETDRHTSYEAYYHMQNAIVAAYNHLRSGGLDCPMRISESQPKEGGAP